MRTPWGSRGSRQPMEPGESPSSGSPSPVASGLSFLGGFIPSFFGQEQRPPGGSSGLQEERRKEWVAGTEVGRAACGAWRAQVWEDPGRGRCFPVPLWDSSSSR